MYKIALLGKANTGKNTVADLIERKTITHQDHGFGRQQLAFADPIKENVRNMFPHIRRQWLFGPSKFRNKIIEGAVDANGAPLSVRQALINEGTRGREYNPNIWLNVFEHRFRKYAKRKYGMIIVTDVRFRDEFDYLRDQDFFMVRVKRNTDSTINHASETNQDSINDSECNFVIDNNYDLSHLIDVVNKELILAINMKFDP